MEDYKEIQPSLFRESEVLDTLLQTIFSVCDKQQEDLLWVSQNLLNIDAAEKSQLDFIGNIVGQARFLSDFNTEPYFGYDGSYQSKTFGSSTDPEIGGYWNSRSYFNTATSRKLSDDEYRRLIKARVIYNQSNCTANDLLEVINLITNSKNNTVQMLKHGLVQINSDDSTGILSYFVDRLLMMDNILPIAAGVRVGLESVVKTDDNVVSDGNLIFSVESYESINNYYPLHIYIYKPEGDWSLMESGVVIADSTGFVVENVILEILGDYVDIYLRINTPETKYFELDATARSIDMSYYDYTDNEYNNTPDSESALGKVVITEFSSKTPTFSTGFNNTHLIVPEFLPPELIDISYLFYRARLFNQDISMWDVSNVINMENMFEAASTFNQDLSSWCVTNITTKPIYFDEGATSWTLTKPIWGSCPRGENLVI